MLGARFNDREVSYSIKWAFTHGAIPPLLGDALLASAHLFHDEIPGAFGDFGIRFQEICPRNLKICDRMMTGLFLAFRIRAAVAASLVSRLSRFPVSLSKR